ncbi:MAG: FAD-dependent oxidoreductase [Pseudomonadota bacterium]|nr:FAD-dependent oxidoreductase [Pseudomonadota bacterium]
MANAVPDAVEIVIVGGGIVGCSIAYHLTQRGRTDVLLLEQHQLTAGTTWHAAGLVAQLRASRNLTRLARYTTELFADLEARTGQATGFRTTGSISVALNEGRMEELLRQATSARAFGVEVEPLAPEQILDYWPDLSLNGVHGAVRLPGDGQTNPVDTTMALATGARAGGATIREGLRVDDLLIEHGRIVGVRTPEGEVRARTVVLAAGMWTRQLAARAGVAVPLQAAEHFYLVTKPMPVLTPGMPTLRMPDEQVYLKEDAGKLLVGAFELEAKPWAVDGVPDDFAFGTLPEDFDHFEPILAQALKRYPPLADAGVQLLFNGPESFTPDDRYLLGPTAEHDNLFVAAGFNSIGIQSSGGAGKVLADWIVDGHAPMDLFDVDVRRSLSFQSNKEYLADRITETLGLLYAMHWPFRQYESARGARRSALHRDLLDEGAVMGELAGWERPNWYARNASAPRYAYSYGRQNWFDACREECLAVRDRVALFDQSSYPIFVLRGPDACRVLDRVSANSVDVPVDRVVYTQWLNARGGIEADVTVTRLAVDAFMIVSSVACAERDHDWLRRHIPVDARAELFREGAGTSILGLMGPAARTLLQALTPDDVSDAALSFYHSKRIELGYARIRANRLSYVGELGYELYVPTEFVQHVHERIVAAGAAHGLLHAGFHAMNSCRMEKGYRHYGHDLDSETSPLAAGLGFALAMDKGDFIGRDALKRIEQPLRTRLVNVAVDDEDAPLLLHDEPIYLDGEMVGLTTSGMWGHRVERSLGIASISHPDGVTRDFLTTHRFEIEVASRHYPATLQLAPFYDPRSARMKG